MRRNQLSVLLTGLASAALAAMAAAAPVMAAVSENSPGGGGNSESGERIEEAAEDRKDALREGQSAEAEEEITSAATPGVTPRNGQETKAGTEENAPPATQNGKADAETAGVYEFPDTKTSGTVTVVKKWDDQSTNAERPRADISISAQKPSKSPLGYTVTFHADTENGLTFTDGSTENEVVYNGSGQIVSGAYKGLTGGSGVVWYTDRTYQTQVELNADGTPAVPLTGDVDVWPKEVTFEIKGYSNRTGKNEFNQVIPSTATTVVFTDEAMPEDATLIDVDADGDGGAVAWTEENETVMKISTQVKGAKVQAAKNSGCMFQNKSKIQTIDFTNLDTAKVTSMSSMFQGCSGLTSLDLSSFVTSKATDMYYMFNGCSGLTGLDLSALNTANVTDMGSMFYGCSKLTNLDVSSFDTRSVTNMGYMFSGCSGLMSLDVSSFDTNKVTNMDSLFNNCSKLTNLDVSSFDTSKVTNMSNMFLNCSSLTNLDVSSFDTSKVTNMSNMFRNCRGLTSLDLSSFDTRNVTSMGHMFFGCSGLTSLDVSTFDTANVTNMGGMFGACGSMINLDLSTLNTAKVTDMDFMFYDSSKLMNLDLSAFDTSKVTSMRSMFQDCSSLTTLTTGTKFRFGTGYYLSGTWRNTAGETFTSGTFPSNIADTYIRIS